MRYGSPRQYPITRMKKDLRKNNPERVADITIGTAAGILAAVFIEGLLCGYLLCKSFHKSRYA